MKMKILRNCIMVAVIAFSVARSAHAQSGCTDSPEAPTDILLLVGAVGVFQGQRVIQWLRKRS